MKRAVLAAALLLFAAGYVFLQTISTAPRLPAVMPGGASLCLEAPEFGRLVRDWDGSKVKADWLASANYGAFSRSNLFSKLHDVYGEYGQAAGFLPDLKSLIEIAGTDSALALYGIRDVEFLYVSRIPAADLMKSRLWALRGKFETRQAEGASFYLRTDPASKRTVAFAFVDGCLLLATGDDLVAQALELIAGGGKPSIASDRWYRDAAATRSEEGELRLTMNLESLARSVYVRSYWVQRNVSEMRRYRAGIADVKRTGGDIVESRVFLRAQAPGEVSPPQPDPIVPALLALVPPEAGLYKAWRTGEPSETAVLIARKLIGVQPGPTPDWRDAPAASEPDNAGDEGDLETRIDEQPLPADPGTSGCLAAIRAMLEKGGARAILLVQSSSPAGAAAFVETPSVVVLDGAADWDADLVRQSLASAAQNLWTTSRLGAGWAPGTAGRHAVERLDGLGILLFASSGKLLFLANDSGLLAAVLDRAGTKPQAGDGGVTYAAGFRHLRERSSYQRIMAALDFTSSAGSGWAAGSEGAPRFFSENIASLSRVLSGVEEVRIAEEDKGDRTVQTVVYRLTH
ncbi:MAG: hypothetical protein ABSH56_30360 [Bryobacteraceae bacterium]|jgi:hypothetical protein